MGRPNRGLPTGGIKRPNGSGNREQYGCGGKSPKK